MSKNLLKRLTFFSLCAGAAIVNLSACAKLANNTHESAMMPHKMHTPEVPGKMQALEKARAARLAHLKKIEQQRRKKLPTGRRIHQKKLDQMAKKADDLLNNVATSHHEDKTGHIKDAIKAYEQAAIGGDAYSQYMMGIIYQYGLGVPVDIDYAGRWFKRAEKNPRAVHGQLKVGMHYNNSNSPIHDVTLAAHWYERAANGGNVLAATKLGDLYNNGQGHPTHYIKALKWYGKAASKGSAYAQYSIGILYYNGHGLAKNNRAAATWLQKAARQGFDEAQYQLGLMYRDGIGVKHSKVIAYAWWSQVKLKNRLSTLKQQTADLVKGMSAKDVARAVKLANEYKIRFS